MKELKCWSDQQDRRCHGTREADVRIPRRAPRSASLILHGLILHRQGQIPFLELQGQRQGPGQLRLGRVEELERLERELELVRMELAQ